MNIKSLKPEHIVIIMDGNGRWAEKNNFNWYSEFDLPKQWIE